MELKRARLKCQITEMRGRKDIFKGGPSEETNKWKHRINDSFLDRVKAKLI